MGTNNLEAHDASVKLKHILDNFHYLILGKDM
jgi:hypothetical protein